MTATTMDTLVLSANHVPIARTRWQRALILLLEEKADLIESYAGQVVHPGRNLLRPAVIRLHEFVTLVRRPKLTRKHVLARDSFTCQYCGVQPRMPGKEHRPDLSELTIDHVIPRARAVNGKIKVGHQTLPVNSWGNLVAACVPCNTRKRDRTPKEAGMPLRKPPQVPNAIDALRITLARVTIPNEWLEYLPEGHGWHGYWDAELDPD